MRPSLVDISWRKLGHQTIQKEIVKKKLYLQWELNPIHHFYDVLMYNDFEATPNTSYRDNIVYERPPKL